MSYNNSQYWYHYDEHGNVIRMTDASGVTVVKYKYDAWGNITEKTANSTIADINPYRYTGAEGYWYDENTNKYFLQARYYDPEIGRFLSKDPVELTIGESNGLNPYVYAINNPVMFIDPSGETSFFNRLKAAAGGIITVWVTVRVGAQIAVKKVQKLLFKGAGKNIIKTFDDVVDEATFVRKTKGNTRMYDKSGGYNKALEDFNSLGVKNVQTKNGRTIGELSDGTYVNIHKSHIDELNRWTLEYKKVKIRYND